MQTPLHLLNKLLRPSPQDHRARLRRRTLFKQIIPLIPDLSLLERPTRSQMMLLNPRRGALN